MPGFSSPLGGCMPTRQFLETLLCIYNKVPLSQLCLLNWIFFFYNQKSATEFSSSWRARAGRLQVSWLNWAKELVTQHPHTFSPEQWAKEGRRGSEWQSILGLLASMQGPDVYPCNFIMLPFFCTCAARQRFFPFLFFYCSGFCHTLKWNSHGFTCVPHPNPPSHLPLHPIPIGLPSAPGPSACLMHPTWADDQLHPR